MRGGEKWQNQWIVGLNKGKSMFGSDGGGDGIESGCGIGIFGTGILEGSVQLLI